MPMDDLSAALRRERELLDQLRFRFTETRLLLAARETRYLAWATAEVRSVRTDPTRKSRAAISLSRPLVNGRNS